MSTLKQDAKTSRLGAAIRDELTRADDPALKQARAKAIRYYLGLPRGDEVKGRSAVVSTDIGDAVNAITAQLLPMISTDAVVEFEADGPDDEPSSEAESAAVNRVIIENNQGLIELQEALRDALLLRSGVVKVWCDKTEDSRIERYESASDEVVGVLLEQTDPNERRELVSRDGDKASIKIARMTAEFRFEAVDPTLFMFRANWTSTDLELCPFVAETIYYTRSELIEMGVKREVAEALPSVSAPDNYDGQVRDRGQQRDFGTTETALEVVECHECYILYDWNDDGVAERLRVLLGGEAHVLEREEAEFVPYAVGSVILRPHRLVGESVADRLEQVQDGKTASLRQWIDNLTIANNQRTILNDAETNLSDATDSKPGGVVRSRNPGNVVPYPFTDTGPSNLGILSYYDEMRTESVGAALDMQTSSAQLTNVATAAVERQYTSKELVVALFAKNFSETLIRRAWTLMHTAMRLYAVEPMPMKLAGDWVMVDPRKWKARTKLNVRTGMSIGQRAHAQSTLQAAIQFQTSAMQMGREGQLADNATLHRTYRDWLTLAGLESPERYAIDPASPPAKEAAQRAQQAQGAQQKAQEQVQQAIYQLELTKLRQQAKEASDDVAFKYYDARLKAEIEEAKLVGKATLDLEKAQMEATAHERQMEREARPENGDADAGGAGR